MARIRQSVSWWCFARGEMTPEKLVHAAAEIGYEAVELVGQEHWPLIRQHGLTIASAGGHQSLSDGLNKRENHDRIEREVNANLKLAVEWGIPNLICFSGNRNGLDDATGAEITADGLRRVAKAAEEAGVNLVVELLNSKVDHKDYQCDHTLQQGNQIEPFIAATKPLFLLLPQRSDRQEALVGGLRLVISLGHASPLTLLGGQLEGGLKEVDVPS